MKNKTFNMILMLYVPFGLALNLKSYFVNCAVGSVSLLLFLMLIRFWGNIISFCKKNKNVYMKYTLLASVLAIFVGIYFGDNKGNTLWFLFLSAIGALWIMFVTLVRSFCDEEKDEDEIVIKNPAKEKKAHNNEDDDDEDVVFP